MTKKKVLYAIVKRPRKYKGVYFLLDGHEDTFLKEMLSKVPIRVEPSKHLPAGWYEGNLPNGLSFNYHKSWLKFVENK